MVVGVFLGARNSGNFPEYYASPGGTEGAAKRQHSELRTAWLGDEMRAWGLYGDVSFTSMELGNLE